MDRDKKDTQQGGKPQQGQPQQTHKPGQQPGKSGQDQPGNERREQQPGGGPRK
jgi:hypothetical protein